MSATNRGAARAPNDYYATPAWAVRALFPHLHMSVSCILDPGCGDGAITRAILESDAFVTVVQGVEIDRALADRFLEGAAKLPHPDRAHVKVGDFLTLEMPRYYDLAIGNPPYSLAREFAERCFTVTRATGTVALLLRLNFLASASRAAWHREHPADIFVLPKRPSFALDKHGRPGTDACEYAWFVWGPGRGGRWSILDVGDVQ